MCLSTNRNVTRLIRKLASLMRLREIVEQKALAKTNTVHAYSMDSKNRGEGLTYSATQAASAAVWRTTGALHPHGAPDDSIMHARKTPTAVRLLGFTPDAADGIASLLADAPACGPLYACLHEDSLQEPDVYLADGENACAMLRLSSMRSPPLALQVGGCERGNAWTRVERPLEAASLHATLAQLVAERRRILERLCACGEPPLPERRRRQRGIGEGQDIDAVALRQPPRNGKVLIVDQGGAFRDHLARLVGEQRLPIAWTDSAPAAVRLCDETPVLLAMINTSTPGIDPYALCAAIKAQEGAGRTAVVFLVGRAFCYDTARAHLAGVRGLLDQPVGDRSLVAMLQRLASMPA